MTVYVDNARNPYRGMLMCHMLADSEAELHAFAARLGLKRRWFQPLSWPHYDLSQSKRAEAVRLGAVPVTQRELASIRRRWRRQRW